VIAGTVLVGVGGTTTVAGAKEQKLSGSITVAEAASLTDAFAEITTKFEKQHPGTKVSFNFSGSGTHRAWVTSGAAAARLGSAGR
jgi:molybdate transport system substrate-binding protein